MKFNPSLDVGYDTKQELEPCLIEFQTAMLWADHILIVTPIWWGGLPSKLKGLFDRTFLPGFSFKYEDDNPFPLQLLKGKTSRIVVTMDAASNYTKEQSAPAIAQLDYYTLQFCGIEKAQINLLGSIISANAEIKLQWEKQVQHFGNIGE
jgi:putative NADPH-quinone reductase